MFSKIWGKISVVIFLLYFPTVAYSWTPPADTPLSSGIHPRLMFIPESYRNTHSEAMGYTLSEMRKKLNQPEYKPIFQSFIDEMHNIHNIAANKKSKMDVTYDAINFAFLSIIDPGLMGTSPYGFNFHGHTKSDYQSKAFKHVEYIAVKAKNETKFGSKNWNDYKT